MIELSNVSILSINTHEPELSVRALQYSSREIKFKSKKILSDRIPNNISDDIEFIETPKFHTRFEYSDYVMNNLGDCIDSEFVLMIHDDGFVINPQLWLDEFLKYDYIGAPWPPHLTQVNRVGNGGFCIRSKKLIDFCKTIETEPSHDDWIIGVIKNEYLKEHGFTFAPIEVAMKFSLELEIPECAFDLTKTFGFHGKYYPSSHSMINLLNEI